MEKKWDLSYHKVALWGQVSILGFLYAFIFVDVLIITNIFIN